jgi:hypothetical protein
VTGRFRTRDLMDSAPWFYKQILRLAAGGDPELELTGRSAIGQHFRREYKLAQARKLAARQGDETLS